MTYNKGSPIKWYNITQYVDIETGEIIKKELIKKKLILIKIIGHDTIKEFKRDSNGTYGICTRTNHCRKYEQRRLEL